MKFIGSREIDAMSAAVAAEPGRLVPNWIEGPVNGDQLDVGLVTMSPGGKTPAHAHIGGQVIVVTAGRGFLEVEGERSVVVTGDVVVCSPGEVHVHGAFDDGPFAHLTITTRGYTVPD